MGGVSVVHVEHRSITSTFRGDKRALRAIQRALPRTGWHLGVKPDEIIVGSNRVDAAIAALEQAGFRVVEEVQR